MALKIKDVSTGTFDMPRLQPIDGRTGDTDNGQPVIVPESKAAIHGND